MYHIVVTVLVVVIVASKDNRYFLGFLYYRFVLFSVSNVKIYYSYTLKVSVFWMDLLQISNVHIKKSSCT